MSEIYYIFHRPVTFSGIGHTISHLPWENTVHTSYKYAGSLSHLVTILTHQVHITAG